MNYWFWLLIILIPIIVFGVKPQASLWLRIGRLALAVGLAYMFINLALHLNLDRAWEAYNFCRLSLSENDGPYEMSLALKMDKICPSAPNTGPRIVAALLLGWIAAIGYTGLWELIWRLRYHARIKEMGKSFEGKWVSNIVIGFAFVAAKPTWLFLSSVAY